MARHPEREYGLGDPMEMIRGIPRVKGMALGLPPCPNCGCETMYNIQIDVECALLVGGKGTGNYVGCPACPFASPMIMMVKPTES